MFLATAASVGHRIKRPEFVDNYFTSSYGNVTVNPTSVLSDLQSGDMLIVCSTVSYSSGSYPNVPVSTTGGPSWTNLVNVFSSDTNDSWTRVSYAVHNGNSYSINLNSSYFTNIHQVLAFRTVSTITTINSGSSSSTAYVFFPTITPGYSLSDDGVLQLGGGGQYRASTLGTYPDPGVYDTFASYVGGVGVYDSGTVGFGFYEPGSFTTNIPSVSWSGAAYNNSRSSTFDITLRLQK